MEKSKEDLIRIALSGPLDDVEDGLNEAQRFCFAFFLEGGKCKVKGRYLWSIYQQWAKKPINKFSFYYHLSQMFKTKREQPGKCPENNRMYFLNKNYYDIACRLKELKNL